MDLDFEVVADPEVFSFDSVKYQYFNQLLNKRTVVFNGDITEAIVESVYLPLKDFEEDDSTAPVTLILNSSGGSVSDSLFLAYYIANYKKELNIIVPGYAASMATVILAGGGSNEKVHRICFPCSYGLIHDGYLALQASEAKTAADIMTFNDKIDKRVRKFFIDNTNITEELYDAHARKQWFLDAEEMKELNLIDSIIGESD